MAKIRDFTSVSVVIADGKGSEGNLGFRLENLKWVCRIKDMLIQVSDPEGNIQYIGYSAYLAGENKFFGATCSDWHNINPDNMVRIGGRELENLLQPS